jgi:hypothetical protein
MNNHPYLRAYMAGIAVLTPLLLVALTLFSIARFVCNAPSRGASHHFSHGDRPQAVRCLEHAAPSVARTCRWGFTARFFPSSSRRWDSSSVVAWVS